jgi:hypothetical protein
MDLKRDWWPLWLDFVPGPIYETPSVSPIPIKILRLRINNNFNQRIDIIYLNYETF